MPILRSLLAGEASATRADWLEHLPAITDVEHAAGERETDHVPGHLIGPYRLLRELGRGGMGDVWLAERTDGKLKRGVALKLPILSLRKSVLLQRFERERDILGSLNHPNIAHLYDAGLSEEGQPYLALEYVEGLSITQYADTQALDARACVQLLRQILDAVQYAHANLVIHRDIKPGNVLVTAQGKALLLDFGIAKILQDKSSEANESDLTRVGGRALTLHYAAPEQVTGQAVSIATDVWALGVLLYELLTGLRPFEGSGRRAVEDAVLHSEPARPSNRKDGRMTKLSKGLAADLDIIVLKALNKAAPDRYATVNALAEDLDRWLNGEAVLAQPNSSWYRTRKFVGRNKTAVFSGLAALLLITTIAAVAVVMGLRAGDEAARAAAARDFQIDMFRQANTDLTQGQEISARQLLEQGRTTLLKSMESQPRLRIELLRGIAEAQIGIEQWTDADETLSLLAASLLEAGNPRDAAMAMLDRAQGATEKGDFSKASAVMSQARSMYPGHTADEAFMARHLVFQIAEAHGKGDFARGRELVELVRPMASRVLTGTDRRDLYAIRLLAEMEGDMGDSLQAANRLNALLHNLSGDKKAAPNAMLGVLDDLAQLEILAGRFHTSMVLYETASSHCDHDLDPNGRQCTLMQLHRINNLLVLGYFENAMKAIAPVLASVRLQKSSNSIGSATLEAYRVLIANDVLAQYPDISSRLTSLGTVTGEKNVQAAVRVNVFLLQAEFWLRQHQPTKAEFFTQKAATEFESGALKDARLAARLQLHHGLAAQALGLPELAVAKIQKATDMLGREIGSDHPLTLLISAHQVRALCAIDQKAKALAILDHALPVLQDSMGEASPNFLSLKSLREELAISLPGAPSTLKRDFYM